MTKIEDTALGSDPLVSVIMPVYNVEQYIAEAINSVLSQTYKNFELIIVDDGGNDRSMRIALGYDDPRIRIVRQENGGLAAARNTGINHAHGKYIALLDSDDRWLPNKLTFHVIHLETRPNVGVSYCGSHFINRVGKRLRQAQRPKLGNITPHYILWRNPVGNGSAAVIRRAALDEVAFPLNDQSYRLCYFDEQFRQSEDIELWVRLALTSRYIFDGIAPLLTEYRVVESGLSANIGRQLASWQAMIDKTREIAPHFIAVYGDVARAYQLRYLARRAVQIGDGSLAHKMIWSALKTSARPLIDEPIKTVVTIAAALATKLMHPKQLNILVNAWTATKSAA